MRKIIIAVAVIAVGGIVGFWTYRTGVLHAPAEVHEVGGPGAQPPGLSTEPGDEGGEPAQAGLTARVPDTLPDFTLDDRDGKPKKLSDWSGRPLMVNFWATWCEPCRREIPLLKSLREERSGARLEVVGIAIDVRDPVLDYAKSAGIDYPILIGEQEGFDSAMAFGVPGVLPFTVFADSKGRVVTLKIGELHRDEADFILDRIQDVEAGTLDLATAKTAIAARLKELSAARAAS